jgi:hypothetical protein
MSEYDTLFQDLDTALNERFGELALPFHIIGWAALEMAGLPSRGTKDIDALEEFLRIDALSEARLHEVEAFLETEFGKKSPGERRHGLYLDLVAQGIAWLPPKPRFIEEQRLTSIIISRLHPADVCVSKTFSHFKQGPGRGRDRTDIITAIEAELIDVADYVDRMGSALNHHEIQSNAEVMFPKIVRFIEEEIIEQYEPKAKLCYTLPSWMENA